VPLRQALRALAEDQRVAIYFDRRVDPEQKITVSLSGEPLATALNSIARSQQLGVCLIGELVYFGPPREVDRLRSVLALRNKEVARLPVAARRALTAKAAMSWEELSSPADLLKELGKTGVRIYGEERIPHDLWPAANLPPLAWVDRVAILAAQFDQTIKFSPDAKAIALIPIPADLRIDESAHMLPRVSPAPTTGGKQVYTLKIENQPVGKLLQALCKQLGVELAIDEEAIKRSGRSLETLVSFEVRGVDIDALLRAATEPAGLSFERSAKAVTIIPGP
jgi:hypothetical protein